MNNSYENESQAVGNEHAPPPVTPFEPQDINNPSPTIEHQVIHVSPTIDHQETNALPTIDHQERDTSPVIEHQEINTSPVIDPQETNALPIVEHQEPIDQLIYGQVPQSAAEPIVTQAQNEDLSFLQASSEAPTQGVPEWSFRRRVDHIPPDISEPTYREPTYRAHDNTVPNMYTPGLNIYGYPSNYTNRRTADFVAHEPSKKRKHKVGGFIRALCLVLVCALVSAGATYAVIEHLYRTGDNTQVNQVILGGTVGVQQDNRERTTPVVSAGVGMTGAEIYRMALTQVVGISIDIPTTGFFGNVGTNTVAGSGFIISTDGYILTNHHVIEPALQHNLPINVIMHDSTQHIAQVVGYEVLNDVALLKIDAQDLNAAALADFGTVEPGQRIYAIGNPLGSLHNTMTAGVVSAVGRTVTVEGTIINAFQFDAAVNRGNSGGPLYNESGKVVGIVTAKLSRSDVEGIGFAIPISDAIEIASGLIEHGYIAGRPLLGITGQTVSASHAEYYEWVIGAYVRAINPGSAAENANLEVGDIIVGLGGTQVTSMDTLRFAMRSFRSGETTTISVWRSGNVYELNITFDEDLTAGQPGRTTPIQLEPGGDISENELTPNQDYTIEILPPLP